MKNQIYKFFADYIYTHTGICYKEQEYYRLDSRFNALIKHFGLQNLEELHAKYSGHVDPQMHTILVDLCTNNETYFMRDLKPFKALGKDVITYVREELKVAGTIDIWSAACSTGQEPYSILMAIESFGSAHAAKMVKIWATDISTEALDRAKEGIYTGLEVQRGLPANFLIKYFTQEDERWRIRGDLKQQIKYDHFNLLKDRFPLNKFQIIFCRNVLIYQDPENKNKILKEISNALVPGGLLFMGAGESLIGMDVPLKQVQFGKAYGYKKDV